MDAARADVLEESGELRFTRIKEKVPGISQKLLTRTLRNMERDGLVNRTVHAVIPPRVDYNLTSVGLSLGAAFCGVWIWAGTHCRAWSVRARILTPGNGIFK